jgi:SAM-dependent methyltransferase
MKTEKIIKLMHLRFKFDVLRKYFNGNDRIDVLDIGAGNHSASIFKEYYPNSYYIGIDRIQDYRQDDCDFIAMDEFIQVELEQDDLDSCIEDKKFDVIIMSHIIEHISNAEEIIEKSVKKLKHNGIIYIEWPSEKSAILPYNRFPTLNFYDDDTHVRIYSFMEICNLLRKNGLKYTEGGYRKHKKEILFMPFIAIYSIIIHHRISGSVLWDIMGFANYCVFRRI